MRKLLAIGTLGLAVLLFAATVAAQQRQGRVTNRDGAGQPNCQVIFSGPSSFTVYTNSAGYFYIDRPNGTYSVTVKWGQREQEFKEVTIDSSGLTPSTLVIDW